MKRLSLLALLAAFSGCTLWYALEGDPGDIPCADEFPFCLEGYTCIEEPASGERLCRLAAALEEGQPCNADGECVAGLVCADFYDEANCPEEIRDLDPNCNVGFTGQKTCRRVCNPNGDPTECPTGQRCFADNLGSGFCQAGTCTDGSDCGTNPISGETNVCFQQFNGDGSGLCLNHCRPFGCETPGANCNDCPVLDQNTWGCVPIPAANQLIADRYGCVPVGITQPGQGCGGDFDCRTDGFCTSVLTGGAGICSQYCATNGGAPACDVGACTGQLADPEIGFCQ